MRTARAWSSSIPDSRQPAAFAIATDRYIRDSEDDQIVEDPVVADTLYLASEDITARRDERVPLYSTEVMPSGAPAKYPFTLHGNAVVALALDVFRRTLDEEAAAGVEDPAAVRAAIRRHFAVDRGEKARLAVAVDLTDPRSVDTMMPAITASPDRTDSASFSSSAAFSFLAALSLPTASKGAVTTLPVVETVVVTILPAVLTGTVTREQPGVMRHRTQVIRMLVFIYSTIRIQHPTRACHPNCFQNMSTEMINPMAVMRFLTFCGEMRWEKCAPR